MLNIFRKKLFGLFIYKDKVYRARSKKDLAHWIVYKSNLYPPAKYMTNPTAKETVKQLISQIRYFEPMEKGVTNVRYDSKKDKLYPRKNYE